MPRVHHRTRSSSSGAVVERLRSISSSSGRRGTMVEVLRSSSDGAEANGLPLRSRRGTMTDGIHGSSSSSRSRRGTSHGTTQPGLPPIMRGLGLGPRPGRLSSGLNSGNRLRLHHVLYHLPFRTLVFFHRGMRLVSSTMVLAAFMIVG